MIVEKKLCLNVEVAVLSRLFSKIAKRLIYFRTVSSSNVFTLQPLLQCSGHIWKVKGINISFSKIYV